jgi:hypothetical protein
MNIFHQPTDKTSYLTQWTLALRRQTTSLLCVPPITKKCRRYWTVWNAIWSYTQLQSWKLSNTMLECQAQTVKYCNLTITISMPKMLIWKNSTSAYISYLSLLSKSLSQAWLFYMNSWVTYKKYLQTQELHQDLKPRKFSCLWHQFLQCPQWNKEICSLTSSSI